MLIEALSTLVLNNNDISLNQYKQLIPQQSISKIERIKKNASYSLSQEAKNKINNHLLKLIDKYHNFIPLHKKSFLHNFDRWETEESKELLVLLNSVITGENKFIEALLKMKKHSKKYPSIIQKLDILISLNNDFLSFTKQYLQRAKEADQASKFMDSFITNNQEVLKALA